MTISRFVLPFFLIITLFVFSGCNHQSPITPPTPTEEQSLMTIESLPAFHDLYYPVESYADRLTVKKFGQEVHDRFNGWHTGDDLEVFESELETEIPVYAIADGEVIYAKWTSGYGGLVILEHSISGQILHSLYGHIDLNSLVPRFGEAVKAGTRIAFLGDDSSTETDQERKHLHFGIYPGSELRINGYADRQRDLDQWINPSEYLQSEGAATPDQVNNMPEDWIEWNLSSVSEFFPISLLLPTDWEAIAIPEIESIAIVEKGEEPVLERTQIFLRYFDANDFLTLTTVTIQERLRTEINEHEAIEYLIEKKPWANDFPNQPTWRNQLHRVTDIREQDGFSRFYVFGQNPETDEKTIDYILHSIIFN